MENQTLSYLSSRAAMLFAFLILIACNTDPKSTDTKASTPKATQGNLCSALPDFDRDSALSYVQRQIDFGPRTPGSEAHADCALWLHDKLASHGLSTQIQTFDATVHTGKTYQGKNIIGRLHPDNPRRILLCAHWDSRPMADYDPVADNQDEAVPGANDGASGVGVLLELSRLLGEMQDFPLGVDIVFFDLEDYGISTGKREDVYTWGLGSQYWSSNRPPRKPEYGILLDMVGAADAQFRKEAFSMKYARGYVDKIWSHANLMGYSNYFVNEESNPITDDHFFINTIAGIPTLDIIHQQPGSETGFFEHWHTVDDDMEHISARTLDAVGTVLLSVLCREAFEPAF